ncbi:MAG: ribosome silencing factor [Bacteroidota bacterium]
MLSLKEELPNLTLQASPVIRSDDNALVDLIIDSIQDIKGKRITKLDLREVEEAPANYFIICEGESITQVRAISQNINRRVKSELSIRPAHTEGIAESKWILVDYFDTIVHVFYPETRAFYDLEELWNDANFTHYEDLP